MNSGEIFVQGT